jgi:hypothetical protein
MNLNLYLLSIDIPAPKSVQLGQLNRVLLCAFLGGDGSGAPLDAALLKVQRPRTETVVELADLAS